MNDDRPLYQRDPAAWNAYLAEGNAKQARKRVGADVLIRDEDNRILLVNPRYKPDWDLPGGMVEANEPPHKAAERELREELGLEIQVRKILAIDWVAPHGPWDDSLMFIFDGGTMSSQQSTKLKPTDNELLGYKFCTPREAEELLQPKLWNRVQYAIFNSDKSPYLSNGVALKHAPSTE